jgi:hypothetical protein
MAALAVMLGWNHAAVAASQPSVEAQVSTDSIGVGEQATYSITVQNADGAQLQEPSFGDLTIVAGPTRSSQSSIMIMNGQTQATTSIVYTWTIEAPREGKFTIGPAKLEFHGQTLESNQVTVNCSGQAAPRPNRRSPFSSFPDPFDQLDQFDNFPGFNAPSPRHGDSDLFLRAVVDRNEVYLGDQVTLTIYAYSTTPLAGVQNMSVPKLDGFWAEDLEAPSHLEPEQRLVNRTPYYVYMLRRRALFPLRAGELTIEPFEAEMSMSAVMFFGAPPEVAKRKSAPVKLTVKPLPAAGQPPNFEATSVGSYTLHVDTRGGTVQLGQPLQVKVTLEGTGNIKSVRIPRPQLPPGLKTYDPTVTDKARIIGGKYGGTRTMEWVIIAERTGDFVIPPIELPLFDPARGEYTVARTQPISLHVTAVDGAIPMAAGDRVAAPPVSNVLSGGIRPIRIQADAAIPAPALWRRTLFWPLTAGPVAAWVLLLSGGFVFQSLRRRDPTRLKERRARSAASRRLKTARAMLAANDASGFHAEVTQALQQFVTDKTRVAALGLTRAELGRALIERGYPEEHVANLTRILERCENARFAPGGTSKSDLTSMLDEASETLDALERVRPVAKVA